MFQYSKKCNINPFIVCVLCEYSVLLTNASGSITCFVVEMCPRNVISLQSSYNLQT